MKVETEEQPILRLYANFELDQSVNERTGAKKEMLARTFFQKNAQ
jgi:hypothetical protein